MGHKSKNTKNLITCDQCTGLCCREMSIHISSPETDEDYENIKWFLYHDKTHLIVDDNDQWIIQINLECKMLDKKTWRCKTYKTRPPLCENAPLEHCAANECNDSIHLYTAEDIDNWRKNKGLVNGDRATK